MITNRNDITNNCICCGTAAEWKEVTSLPTFLFGLPSEIFRCIECGLGKTSPEPKTTIEYYEDNKNYDALFTKGKDLYESFARNLLGQIKEKAIGKNNKLLDIGSGGGFLVSAANKMGFLAQGIDANRSVIQWAKSQGLPVEQGDVEEKILNHEQYDVVVLSAVLEHLSNPKLLLLQCKELLKPGGILLVSQASYDGLLPKLFPWGWYGWQPEEHFWHFTPDSFKRLASSCDLNVIRCERNSLYHDFHFSGGLKTIVGRNLATLIARLGVKVGRGDNFDCIMSKAHEL